MNRKRNTPSQPATAPGRLALRSCAAAGAAALTAFLAFAPMALSCGYEDPNSAVIQRGVLNFAYPEALHVIGALTRARMAGMVETTTGEAVKGDLFGSQFHKTAKMLHQLGDALSADPDGDLVFSMLLIEPMLWTRFAVRDGRVVTSVHTDGPARGDAVVIATEAALPEIVAHRLTPDEAFELGLMRLYGDPTKLGGFRAR